MTDLPTIAFIGLPLLTGGIGIIVEAFADQRSGTAKKAVKLARGELA